MGEAACVSVHGANRLGSNIADRSGGVRPGDRPPPRRAGQAQQPARPHATKDADDMALARLDHYSATPRAARRRRRSASRCSRRCRPHCAVFRTERDAAPRASAKIDKVYAKHAGHSASPIARLIWNTDLIETLELDNMLAAGGGDDAFAPPTARKAAARTCTRISPDRDDEELDEAHHLPGSTAGAVR